ncbi:HAD-like domain-containing protein [Spinellus fusiger]|nr:HAD-like domain-containing protein [Spinellus fusiger]
MLHSLASRSQKPLQTVLRRAYTSGSKNPDSTNVSRLTQEALAQKTGQVKNKSTLPKGDKKPSKGTQNTENYTRSIALGLGLAVGALAGGFFYYGRPYGNERDEKYAEDNIFTTAYRRCSDRIVDFQQKMSEPIWDNLLPDPLPEPYRRPYTLVINLNETLVYSTWDKENGWRHAKRPGVDYFLSYLSQFYEIVIFTSQSSMNAIAILDKLDPYQYSMYRLYREATRYVNGQYIKDLSHLNRDLSKVIIMDSTPAAFSMQPENGIALKPWTGEAGDHGLVDFIPFLEAIALTNPDDVRSILKSFDEDIPKEWARREQEMEAIHIKQWQEEQAAKKKKPNLGSLLGGGGASASQPQEEAPPTYLEQMRKQIRETFAAEHEQMKQQQDELLKKDIEAQKEQMREMKLTVWDLMTRNPNDTN